MWGSSWGTSCMKCPTCQTESAHIRIDNTGIHCHKCGGWGETSGTPTDKILTRNAPRITEQQEQFEQDMITPYIVDKSTSKVVVNEDFIDLYPEQAAQTYTASELKSVGQEGLKPTTDIDDGKNIEFSGSEKQAIGDIVKSEK